MDAADRRSVAEARIKFLEQAESSKPSSDSRIEHLTGQVEILLETMTALHNSLEELRTSFDDYVKQQQQQPKLLKSPKESSLLDEVDGDGDGDCEQLDENIGEVKKPFMDEDDEEAGPTTCSICEIKCVKVIKVMVPCGHYPYCKDCIQKLEAKKEVMQLPVLTCPYCKSDVDFVHTLVLLDPLRCTVNEL